MKLKIKITKEVLEATKMCGIGDFKLPGSKTNIVSFNCPITYACRKLFPTCSTCLDDIRDKDGSLLIALLPQEAINFIRNFDNSSPKERIEMEPFEFEVELTQEALDLISIDEITEVLKESTTLEIC